MSYAKFVAAVRFAIDGRLTDAEFREFVKRSLPPARKVVKIRFKPLCWIENYPPPKTLGVKNITE